MLVLRQALHYPMHDIQPHHLEFERRNGRQLGIDGDE